MTNLQDSPDTSKKKHKLPAGQIEVFQNKTVTAAFEQNEGEAKLSRPQAWLTQYWGA